MTVTREILWNVPGWAQALMYVSFVLAAFVCVYGLFERARNWKKGRPSSYSPKPRDIARRFWRHVVLQLKLWRSRSGGLSHACLFWGFIVLFIGTCIVAVEEY